MCADTQSAKLYLKTHAFIAHVVIFDIVRCEYKQSRGFFGSAYIVVYIEIGPRFHPSVYYSRYLNQMTNLIESLHHHWIELTEKHDELRHRQDLTKARLTFMHHNEQPIGILFDLPYSSIDILESESLVQLMENLMKQVCVFARFGLIETNIFSDPPDDFHYNYRFTL